MVPCWFNFGPMCSISQVHGQRRAQLLDPQIKDIAIAQEAFSLAVLGALVFAVAGPQLGMHEVPEVE